MTSKYDAANPPALKPAVARFSYEASPEDCGACYKAARREVYAETSAVNPQFKKIYDSLANFRSDPVHSRGKWPK
jgi:TRAP-type mannitol/chloroaromatic compound transport system substrate-binding protein